MNLRVEALDAAEACAGLEGEATPGLWLHITCDEPFCDYRAATNDEEAREAIGRKLVSLVLETERGQAIAFRREADQEGAPA